MFDFYDSNYSDEFKQRLQDARCKKNFPSRISLIVWKIMTVVVLQTGKVKKVQPFPKPKISLAFAKF